jgi:FG-GAP repeat
MHTLLQTNHRASLRRYLLVLILLCLQANAQTTDYAQPQILGPTVRGEGEPDAQFATLAAIDGDIALLTQANRSQLRGYRRVGGVWQRAPELSIVQARAESVIAMALSGEYLIYSTELAPANIRTVRIMRASTSGWSQSFVLQTGLSPSFGAAVAIAGTRALIGTPGTTSAGAVRVITRSNSNNWSTTDSLTPNTPQLDARFGSSVSIHAGGVVIGAPEEDNGSAQQSAGAAYVFELTGSTWTQVNRLTGAMPLANQRFGQAVAISGLDEGTPERILVGSNEGTGGRVYAFRRGASSYAASFTLDPPAQAGQRFGANISMDGDNAVIGASGLDIGGSNTGALFCADFNANFTAATMVRRNDPLSEVGAAAGFAVAIDRNGPTVLAGAPLADLNAYVDQGIALMSIGTAGTPFPALVRVFDLGQGPFAAYFGRAIANHADTLIIGAPGEAVGNTQSMGAAYLYRRDANGLYGLEARWQSPQGGQDLFGFAVAIHGDLALVGAPNVDLNGTDAGIVYVYRRSGGVWNIETQLLGQCASTSRAAHCI